MENQNRKKKGIKHFYVLLMVLIPLLILSMMNLYSKKQNKAETETNRNRGKIEVYKVQEIEALKSVVISQAEIDSLENLKDSVIKHTQLNDYTGKDLQTRLNQIFNQ